MLQCLALLLSLFSVSSESPLRKDNRQTAVLCSQPAASISVVVWVWQSDRHGYHDRGRQSAESWGGSLTLTLIADRSAFSIRYTSPFS